MAENHLEQLNSLLRRCGLGFCQEDIEAIDFIVKENQELKKQLEEINNFINKANFANIEQLMLDYCAKTEEQKEFIQYLENCINKTDYEVNVLGNYKYLAWSNAYKNALTKYKEIIGVKDE